MYNRCNGVKTGLNIFSSKNTDKYIDVGIAEEHAVTYAAGLAAAGKNHWLFCIRPFSKERMIKFFMIFVTSARNFCLDRQQLVQTVQLIMVFLIFL